MVTAKTQYSLKNAEGYFEEHLCVGDYYDESQRVSGEWLGLGAERLGLSGKVRADDFLQLCKNIHPSTGETFTPRLKTTRQEGEKAVPNRRIFYDFTFSPPKSVSMLALIGEDDRIFGTHARAVQSALREFETFAATRVRVKGSDSDRLTGNIVCARFTHETSRALDPHLHTHCIVFNATFDSTEQRWKALQNYELLRAKKFVENVYYHEVARELEGFGYRIRNRLSGDFEIVGVSEELCDRFSKRHAEIDRALTELLRKKPELANGDLMAIRAQLATAERTRKQRDLSQSQLQQLWESQMTRTERESLRGLDRNETPSSANRTSLMEAVQWAEDHIFDRRSVVLECKLWEETLSRARGQAFSVAELKQFTRDRGYIRDCNRPLEVTLREVLLREWAVVQSAKEGIAALSPLVAQPHPSEFKLDSEQQRALDGLLKSTNGVSVFRGAAGTGKSFVLRALVDQITQCGRSVVVLTPQQQQVVEMETAGFPSPTTVASFLLKRECPEHAAIVVDEAGQIGGRQMHELFQLASERGARLILSGDTRQHGPVEASDALIAIERYSGVRPVELQRIRRQDPTLASNELERRRIWKCRQAVAAAASGNFADSFKRLDEIGAVVTCALDQQPQKLAEEYIKLAEQNFSAVVVSQTWAEVNRVNTGLREALKAKGLIGANDTVVHALDKLDLTNAQKRDERFYPPGAVILFNQKVRQADPGTKGKLGAILKSSVLVEVEGRFVTVSNKFLDRILVCLPKELPLTSGDRLHLKANRKLLSGDRVTKGELVTVKSIDAGETIKLVDGRVLDKGFREFLPGYAITSYGSQGRTVDHVLFSDSTIKAATNAQQWYVTISRGRRGVRIFTPDKEQLRENLTRSGSRPLAIELAGRPNLGRRNSPWEGLRRYLSRFGEQAADWFIRIKTARRHRNQRSIKHEYQTSRMLGERPESSRRQNRIVI